MDKTVAVQLIKILGSARGRLVYIFDWWKFVSINGIGQGLWWSLTLQLLKFDSIVQIVVTLPVIYCSIFPLNNITFLFETIPYSIGLQNVGFCSAHTSYKHVDIFIVKDLLWHGVSTIVVWYDKSPH